MLKAAHAVVEVYKKLNQAFVDTCCLKDQNTEITSYYPKPV